jgi:hypothetical protein
MNITMTHPRTPCPAALDLAIIVVLHFINPRSIADEPAETNIATNKFFNEKGEVVTNRTQKTQKHIALAQPHPPIVL